MGWTEERVEQLKALWTEGLSASQIARVLGGVSRNGVIGKVHRLGLEERRSGSRKSSEPRTFARNPVPPRIPEPEIVEEPPVALADGTFATVMTINDKMCRWPIGDPAESEFHFCGRAPKTGSPYCAAHTQKAYQPAPTRGRKVRASIVAQAGL